MYPLYSHRKWSYYSSVQNRDRASQSERWTRSFATEGVDSSTQPNAWLPRANGRTGVTVDAATAYEGAA